MGPTLTVRTRLAIGFGSTIVLLAFVGGLALLRLASTNAAITEILGDHYPKVRQSTEVTRLVLDNIGHVPHEEDPGRVLNDQVYGFITK